MEYLGGMMKRSASIVVFALALSAAVGSLAAQPVVSEKKDVAIFALGYYGWTIPQETLGNIDLEIQKVFVDLGRFNIIGVAQRLSSGGLEQFIATLKKAKEANFVMPEKYQFGEAILTEAEFNKLLGAFIVAAPVVSNFNSYYDQKRVEWVTELKTNVTFIDVGAGGSVLGITEVSTSGSDKQNQLKSISGAIEAIPMQLQYEIRKIPAFQINTRVLAVSGSEIKLQLGQNMGIKKGDEYSVIVGGMVEGFKDEREAGLVAIKDVGAEVSTGQVVYSSAKLTKDVQLREIPRLGVDLEPYFHLSGGTAVLGVKGVASRGFYGFRPCFAAQIPLGEISSYWGLLSVIPINGIVGGEFNLYMGRLTLTPFAGAGLSYARVLTPVSDEDTDWLSHYGAQAYLRASFLFTRDIKAFAEVGLDYWLSADQFYFENYGGLSYGAGVAFKL
jgi:hypothetical protein